MEVGSLTGEIAIEDQFSTTFDLAIDKIKEFVSEFDGMTGDIVTGSGIAVVAIGAITAAITALGVRGADVNDLSDTMDHFTGSAEASEDAMEGLRKGTLNTVGDFTLAKDAAKLLSSGVKLTAEDFQTLGSAAFVMQNRGLGPTNEMLELVTQAMVTGKTRMLSMKLGVVETSDALADYAMGLGKTVSELTKTEQAEARRLAVMNLLSSQVKSAGEQHRDFGEQIEFARAKVENWVDELASAVAKSYDVNHAIETVGSAILEVFGGSGTTLMDALVNGINAFSRGVVEATPYVVDFLQHIKNLKMFVEDNKTVIIAVIESVTAFTVAVYAAEAAVKTTTAAVAIYNTFMESMKESTTASTIATNSATLSVNSFAAAVASFVLGYNIGSWFEKNTEWGRKFSDMIEYLSLRVSGYSSAQATAMIAQDKVTEAAVKAERQHQLTAKAVDDHKTAADDLAKAQENLTAKFSLAWQTLSDLTNGYGAIVATVNPKLVDQISYYLRLGSSVKTLSDAYPELTSRQIEAIDQMSKKISAAQGDLDKIWDEYDQLEMKGASSFEKQIESIDKWANDLMLKAQAAGTDTAEFYETLTTVWKAKLKDASDTAMHSQIVVNQAVEEGVPALIKYNDAVMGIDTSFQGWNKALMENKSLLAAMDEHLDLEVTKVQTLSGEWVKATDARKAYETGGTITSEDISNPESVALSDPQLAYWLSAGASLAQAVELKSIGHPFDYLFANTLQNAGQWGPREPGFALGGVVTVGENGPERVALPSNSIVAPTGTDFEGRSITIHQHISGVWDPSTVRKMTDLMGDELLARTGLKFSRVR